MFTEPNVNLVAARLTEHLSKALPEGRQMRISPDSGGAG
jgi:hypothetical protein